MYNETNSVKDLTEAYESFKAVVTREATDWDALKNTSATEFQIGVSCMKLADALMEMVVQQDELLRKTYRKVNRLEELLRKIDSKKERPV